MPVECNTCMGQCRYPSGSHACLYCGSQDIKHIGTMQNTTEGVYELDYECQSCKEQWEEAL